MTAAYAVTVRVQVAILAVLNTQIARTEQQVEANFSQHPDAEVYLSQPGLGVVLGARVLAEFGDDKVRYADAKARKNFAGTSPITRQSGKKKVVMAAMCTTTGSLTPSTDRPSPRYAHHQAPAPTTTASAPAAPVIALRQLGNRLVGILHGCLKTGTEYNETKAWGPTSHDQQLAA